MSYTRVIPRDLFNEAKLLKCLGQLALLIHDGVKVPRGLTIKHDTSESDAFQIVQDSSDGSIYCLNMVCKCNGVQIGLRSPLNSKAAYPLWFFLDEEEGEVFNPDGTLSADFHTLCAGIGICY